MSILEKADSSILNYNASLSNFVFLKPKVYFDETGYFDYSGISWGGEMVAKRIGDMLPYEYEIKQ